MVKPDPPTVSTPTLAGTSFESLGALASLFNLFGVLMSKGEKSSIRFGICMGSHKLAISLTLYACDLWLLVVVNYLVMFYGSYLCV